MYLYNNRGKDFHKTQSKQNNKKPKKKKKKGCSMCVSINPLHANFKEYTI